MQRTSKEKISNETDEPWKFVLASFFKDFMEFCLPEIAKQIKWNKGYESWDKELLKIFPTSKTGKRLSDVLMKVWLKSGEEKWVLIHLEPQSGRETDFNLRMFTYAYRIFDKYQKPV